MLMLRNRYAYSTLDVSQASGIAGDWKNASLLWKAADRGQQTMAFHSSPDGSLSWWVLVTTVTIYAMMKMNIIVYTYVSLSCHSFSSHSIQ